MNKKMLLIAGLVSLLLTAGGRTQAQAQDTVRVLFIGNSLTSYNDLPGMIAGLAQAAGKTLLADVYAPGGRKLSQHAADPALLKKIRALPWDFVVLQEQGQSPSFSDEQVAREVYPFAAQLSQEVIRTQPEAGVVFYLTMARRNGDAQNAANIPELATYWGTQERLRTRYLIMAQNNRALIAPVGVAWEQVRRQRPELELYSDEMHPNIAGSYLAACVFYATFFNESPIGLTRPGQLDDPTAQFLQNVADEVVFRSAMTWDWRR